MCVLFLTHYRSRWTNHGDKHFCSVFGERMDPALDLVVAQPEKTGLEIKEFIVSLRNANQ